MTEEQINEDMPEFAKPLDTDQSDANSAADSGIVEEILPPLSLQDLPLALQEACSRAGWTDLMPVQARALPWMLAGKDIMVQSRTGSGKTGAYLLPLLQRLDPARHVLQALILVPTRELAVQVEHEARMLLAQAGLGVFAVYGGVGYTKQMDALREGIQVVVGTPGRILDHLIRRTMHTENLVSLVFDEADRMLSIGFYPDMKEIQTYLPKHRVHTTLFSATYPPHVLNLAGEFLQNPQLLSLSATQVHVAEVQHFYCECQRMDKDRALLRILEVENPVSAIIFCNTKSDVHFVTAVLQGFGFNADELSADLSQNKRESVLQRLRSGEVRFLVATDLAARGIDIPDLSHVILYTPPEDRESYIHRAGRTGRAGAAGVVISLVDIMEKLELQRIAQFYKISLIPHPLPDNQDAASAVSLRVMALLENRMRHLTGLEKERITRFDALVQQMLADPEQHMLLTMLLDDCYQKNMNPHNFFPIGSRTRSSQHQSRGKSDSGRKKNSPAQENTQLAQNTPAYTTPEHTAEDEQKQPRRRRRRPHRNKNFFEEGTSENN